MKKFALIGAAGFVAERHIRAIKETRNQLVAAVDPFDVMGRMDSFFPEAEFFSNIESLGKYLHAQKDIDYISICSPNYLHADHIEFALNNQAVAICEKPLVIFPKEIDRIRKIENETGKNVFCILQLRLHPEMIALREKIKKDKSAKIYDVDLTYITSRGKWYAKSWKGDIEKSGGIAANIGIHFFDLLIWIFGEVKQSIVHLNEEGKAAGFLQLQNARVRWFLSLDYDDIPEIAKKRGMRTYRSITVNGEEIEFSHGFTDLHTMSYQQIMFGEGNGIDEAAKSILLTHEINNGSQIPLIGDYHPFLKI